MSNTPTTPAAEEILLELQRLTDRAAYTYDRAKQIYNDTPRCTHSIIEGVPGKDDHTQALMWRAEQDTSTLVIAASHAAASLRNLYEHIRNLQKQ